MIYDKNSRSSLPVMSPI